jgi:hypothetical protein
MDHGPHPCHYAILLSLPDQTIASALGGHSTVAVLLTSAATLLHKPDSTMVAVSSHRRSQKGQGWHPVQLLFSFLPWIVCSIVFLAFLHAWEDGDTRYEHTSHTSLLDIPVQSTRIGVGDKVAGESAIISQFQQQNDKNLWADNPNLPDWMKEYFSWHAHQLALISQSNWKTNNRRYLLLRCYREDERCGGVSDRIKPLPLILLAAYQSQRLIFIDWSRPCRLEEFLVPPVGGLNWTTPEWMRDAFSQEPVNNRKLCTQAGRLLEVANTTTTTVVQTHMHDTFGGANQYNEIEGDNAFSNIYHDLFRVVFTPSPPIQRLIDSKSESVGLIPGQYSTAHYRAEYGKEVQRHPILQKESFIQKMALNAVACASFIQPGDPIYFASDNMLALETIRDFAKQENYPIVTFDREEKTPLPLDNFGNETISYLPSDYYSTFIDLYLAGNGICVAHGRGGFGRFANMLSFNSTCVIRHTKSFFPEICNWTNTRGR